MPYHARICNREMKRHRHLLLALYLIVMLAGASSPAASRQSGQSAEPKPRPDLVRQPYSQADVDGGVTWRTPGRAHTLQAHGRRSAR